MPLSYGLKMKAAQGQDKDQICHPLLDSKRTVGATPASAASAVDHNRTAFQPTVLRAGLEVIARQKMKWDKGGAPLPPDQKGSAFKVQPGSTGVIVTSNPVLVKWSEGCLGIVREDQISLVGADDSLHFTQTNLPGSWVSAYLLARHCMETESCCAGHGQMRDQK